MAWRIVEHTADLGIEATGPSAAAVLEQAAVALSSVLTEHPDPRSWCSTAHRTFTLEAPDAPALAVAFFSELVWFLDAEDTLWVQGGVDVDLTEGACRIEARANVVEHDAALHGRGVEVKAVTYHDLEFARQRDGSWRLFVLLDI